jgi:hypothetical protein
LLSVRKSALACDHTFHFNAIPEALQALGSQEQGFANGIINLVS